MSLYKSWSIEETRAVGQKFKAICTQNWDYEGKLTEGKEYTITIAERILSTSPLCTFIADDGVERSAHLTRFEKVQ